MSHMEPGQRVLVYEAYDERPEGRYNVGVLQEYVGHDEDDEVGGQTWWVVLPGIERMEPQRMLVHPDDVLCGRCGLVPGRPHMEEEQAQGEWQMVHICAACRAPWDVPLDGTAVRWSGDDGESWHTPAGFRSNMADCVCDDLSNDRQGRVYDEDGNIFPYWIEIRTDDGRSGPALTFDGEAWETLVRVLRSFADTAEGVGGYTVGIEVRGQDDRDVHLATVAVPLDSFAAEGHVNEDHLGVRSLDDNSEPTGPIEWIPLARVERVHIY